MDSFQKYLNQMLGVSDESWDVYNPEAREERRKKEKRIQTISLRIDEIEEGIKKLTAN